MTTPSAVADRTPLRAVHTTKFPALLRQLGASSHLSRPVPERDGRRRRTTDRPAGREVDIAASAGTDATVTAIVEDSSLTVSAPDRPVNDRGRSSGLRPYRRNRIATRRTASH